MDPQRLSGSVIFVDLSPSIGRFACLGVGGLKETQAEAP